MHRVMSLNNKAKAVVFQRSLMVLRAIGDRALPSYDRARSFSAIALMSEIAGISGTILVFERPLIIKKAVSCVCLPQKMPLS